MDQVIRFLSTPEVAGTLLAAVVLALGGAIVRWYLRRRRLSWEVQYNSKALPDLTGTGGGGFGQVMEQFSNVSVFIVRLRNAGRADIEPKDYEFPISIRFDDRFVLGFRIAEPSSAAIRTATENESFVSDAQGREPHLGSEPLRATVQSMLASPRHDDPVPPQTKRERRLITLPKLRLASRQEYTVAVLLREDTLHDVGTSLSKHFTIDGRIERGKFVRQLTVNSRLRSAHAVRLAIAVLVGVTAVAVPLSVQSGPDYCARGSAELIGSTAFSSVIGSVDAAYRDDCGDATITLDLDGSTEGVRELVDASADTADDLIAFSDGEAQGDGVETLRPEPVAVLVFSVVANAQVDVPSLTRDDVRRIYTGEVTNWNQLGGSRDLPISIVGRNSGSGSRQAFEEHVLGDLEPNASSDDCQTRTLEPSAQQALVTRCERPGTSEVLAEVNRIPGAIGYAETRAAARFGNLSRLELDGQAGTIDDVRASYPFWTVEYLYTRDDVTIGGVARGLIDYLSTDAARARLLDEGFTPCRQADGTRLGLCDQQR